MRHPGISSSLAGEQAGRGFLPVDPPGRKPIGMTVCSGIGAAEVSAPWIDWRRVTRMRSCKAGSCIGLGRML